MDPKDRLIVQVEQQRNEALTNAARFGAMYAEAMEANKALAEEVADLRVSLAEAADNPIAVPASVAKIVKGKK